MQVMLKMSSKNNRTSNDYKVTPRQNNYLWFTQIIVLCGIRKGIHLGMPTVLYTLHLPVGIKSFRV